MSGAPTTLGKERFMDAQLRSSGRFALHPWRYMRLESIRLAVSGSHGLSQDRRHSEREMTDLSGL
jgi:hypothetical protein